MKEILRIEQATKRYRAPDGRTVTALDGASLRLGPGEMRTVRGPSGSGKSTLLLCAGGLLRPESGSVHVAGREVYGLDTEERAALRAREIGFVFQRFHLLPYLSVTDNVRLPALAGGGGDALPRARELVRRFGLWERRDHAPAELSTGERQRVALARALFRRPRLLLADEPTGNLDGENGDRVMEALAECAREGAAVLVVTHDRNRAQEEAYTMNQGRIHPLPPGPGPGTPPCAGSAAG